MPATDTRPNIVIILADDLGCCDLGAYGNTDARTPAIDALAAEALRHEAFYVAPVCAPTRAALLTGRHHLRASVYGVHGGQDHLNLSLDTIADHLRTAGYATGIWGKWHSGQSDGYLPWQRGFDEALMLRLYTHRDPQGSLNGTPVSFPDRWGDDVIVDHAIAFLQQHADQPCFALVSSMTPHTPLDAPADLVAACEGRGLSPRLATLHAQVSLLDTAIGRLRAAIDALPSERPTVCIFLSDNGPAMNENGFSDDERERRNVLGWRGWKGDVWEAGIRSPCFIHWPGHIPAGRCDQPADIHDILPTCCAWAGIPIDRLPADLDGRDIGPMLAGQKMPTKDIHSWVHPAFPPRSGCQAERLAMDEYRPFATRPTGERAATEQVMALRRGAWKLSRNADRLRDPQSPAQELHHLPSDPLERNDRFTQGDAPGSTLSAAMNDWWQQICSDQRTFATPLLPLTGPHDWSIRATACADCGADQRNDVQAVHHLERRGASLSWIIESDRCRDCMPVLTWWQERIPVGATIRLACGGSWCTGTCAADGSIVWDQPLSIDAGRGRLQLTVEQAAADDARGSLAAVILPA